MILHISTVFYHFPLVKNLWSIFFCPCYDFQDYTWISGKLKHVFWNKSLIDKAITTNLSSNLGFQINQIISAFFSKKKKKTHC